MKNRKITPYTPTASGSFMLTGVLVTKPELPKPFKVAPIIKTYGVVILCKKTPTDVQKEKIEKRLRRKHKRRIIIST